MCGLAKFSDVVKKWIYAFNVLVFVSCTTNSIEKQSVEFADKRVMIPFNQLDKRVCSLFADTLLSNKLLRLVKYIKMDGCTPCEISAMMTMERQNIRRGDLKEVGFMYIVETSSREKDFVYAQLCKARIEGAVYLDTCHAFRKANPYVPDNPLFHTFVLNEQDSVVLVGNPFKNEKMEKLLLKVIEKEKQRRKKDKTIRA